ncbi:MULTISPECIES: type II toxin-antitoxin system VapB family antitoxin [Actinomyces]|uniref:Type II toxin-antitoxin system VapB family antitoxin n=1 Tax=Actinomyces respiraculi TaxID=2744574 RepID=A0A7T0PVI3_9ACTO|nr:MULTISPECIES: type II toxin-antitoxin system VapB family antitoxin [Actinomyces]QPL05361.1 type II toxin-antitoxin system VapB family antitoxin [Actinomyces respiraculi]
MIFKAVGDRAPYPDHGVTQQRVWSTIAPRQVRLDLLTTTRATLDLRNLLDDDSTFFGDLFAHVVSWNGELYLETGLHRALRAALQGRTLIHARVLTLDPAGRPQIAPPPPGA